MVQLKEVLPPPPKNGRKKTNADFMRNKNEGLYAFTRSPKAPIVNINNCINGNFEALSGDALKCACNDGGQVPHR